MTYPNQNPWPNAPTPAGWAPQQYQQPEPEPLPDDLDELAAAASGGGSWAGGGYGYYAGRRRGASKEGVALAGFILSLVFPLAGVFVSHYALAAMRRNRNREGHGFALAGAIISWASIVIGLLVALLFMSVIAATFSSSTREAERAHQRAAAGAARAEAEWKAFEADDAEKERRRDNTGRRLFDLSGQ